jgi:O-antigen/teichoic acid export membrane protein
VSFKNSRDNLVANIAQQAVGLVLAIAVPILLSVEEYAQVTVVSVLIAFLPLADLGISIIYSRKLPALYGEKNTNEIATWNATVSRFKLYTSLLFAFIISSYYLHRYQHLLNAILLFCFVVLTAVVAYVIANATVQSDFRYIRNLAIAQVLAKLSVLPGVWAAGVKGWFLGQLFGVLALVFNKRLRFVLQHLLAKPDWALVKLNLVQGLLFSLVATLWLQLVSSGRLYASFAYPDGIVAQYGLLGSIYQIVIALSIAAFVPQTIKIYRLLEQDEASAINYALKLTVYSAPVFIISSLVLTYVSPLVIEILFRKYNVDSRLYAPLMLSLFNAGLMVTQGSLLIGFGKAKLYLATVLAACALYFVYIAMLSPALGYQAAATAQLLALSTYSIAILLLVYSIVKDKVDSKNMLLLAAMPSVLAPLIYFLLFYS